MLASHAQQSSELLEHLLSSPVHAGGDGAGARPGGYGGAHAGAKTPIVAHAAGQMAAIVSSMPPPAGGCQLMPICAQKSITPSMVARHMVARLSGGVAELSKAQSLASASGVIAEAQSETPSKLAATARNGSGKSTHGGC